MRKLTKTGLKFLMSSVNGRSVNYGMMLALNLIYYLCYSLVVNKVLTNDDIDAVVITTSEEMLNNK